MQNGIESSAAETQASTIRAALEPLQNTDAHRNFLQFLNLIFYPSSDKEEAEEILKECAPTILATLNEIMSENSEFSECLLKLWPEQLTNIGAQKCPLPIEEEPRLTKLQNPQGSLRPEVISSRASEENLNELLTAKPLKTNHDEIEPNPTLPARLPFAKSPEFKIFPTPSRDRTTPRRLSSRLSCETSSLSPSDSPRQTPYSPTSDSPIHSTEPATPREKEQSPREDDITMSKSPPLLISNPKIPKPMRSSTVNIRGFARQFSEPRASTSNEVEESTSSPVSLSLWQFSPPDKNEKNKDPKGFFRPTRTKAVHKFPPPTENSEKDQPTKNQNSSSAFVPESLQWQLSFE